VPVVHDALVVLLRDVDRVLVDITNLTLTRTSLLHVFPDALDAAGGWPAVRLALVYRGEVMRQALHASRVTRRVAVTDQPDLALLRCAEQPGEVRARWELPADLDTPRRTRSLLGMRLANWSCPDIAAADVELVLNELVTNAVLHAGTHVHVGLVLDEDGLWVEVRDFNPTQPLTGPAVMTGHGASCRAEHGVPMGCRLPRGRQDGVGHLPPQRQPPPRGPPPRPGPLRRGPPRTGEPRAALNRP